MTPGDIARDSWTAPYFDAGHDLASVFAAPKYQCNRCGAHQIDLSEDLAYGPMRQCAAVRAIIEQESRDE